MSESGTLLVCAAPIARDSSFYSRLLAAARRVVAVDGGARLCLLNGRLPDVVVGDMDSLDSHSLASLLSEGVTLERFPTRKDSSDLDLALASCERTNDSDITVTACLGGRVDHTLVAMGSLARYAHLRPVIREPVVTCWILRGSAGRTDVEVAERGTVFSVIAIGSSAHVSLSGAEYPLSEASLDPLSSIGLSNVVAGEAASVTVHDGTVAVLVPHAIASPPPNGV